MLTLTMRHHRGQSLKSLWDGLAGAWRRLQQHRAWRSHVAADLSGWVRVVEVTHGRKGWHVHLHAVLFVRPGADVNDLDLVIWKGLIVERWADALASQGFSSSGAAQDLKRLSGDPSEALADYFSKATFEVTRADLKDGRHGNVTPFGLLRRFLATGDLEDLDAWHEWERGSKGRRQFGYSRGLRADLAPDVPELDDQAAAELDARGEGVLTIDRAGWRVVREDDDLRLACFVAIESGADLATSRSLLGHVLDGAGVAYTVPMEADRARAQQRARDDRTVAGYRAQRRAAGFQGLIACRARVRAGESTAI